MSYAEESKNFLPTDGYEIRAFNKPLVGKMDENGIMRCPLDANDLVNCGVLDRDYGWADIGTIDGDISKQTHFFIDSEKFIIGVYIFHGDNFISIKYRALPENKHTLLDALFNFKEFKIQSGEMVHQFKFVKGELEVDYSDDFMREMIMRDIFKILTVDKFFSFLTLHKI